MKEYILLTFIAAVGLFGLFSIHHDVKTEQQQKPYFDSRLIASMPIDEKPALPQSQMTVDVESTWPDVLILISNFDANAHYYLDSGNGERETIDKDQHLIRYNQSGKKLIKLIKENILVDAIELNIELNRPPARFASLVQ